MGGTPLSIRAGRGGVTCCDFLVLLVFIGRGEDDRGGGVEVRCGREFGRGGVGRAGAAGAAEG